VRREGWAKGKRKGIALVSMIRKRFDAGRSAFALGLRARNTVGALLVA
jgi:hypothetical protein